MPNWKKIILSGSDVAVNSLEVTNAVSASEFTGSFTGSALLISASIGHLETIYETASVIYSSGSTKFGDTSDDTHEITGSLLVTGSITLIDNGTGSFGRVEATTIDLDRLSLTSTQTTVPPLQLTANSLQDGVGALRIDGSQADIFLNPSTATHTTVTFAVNDDQKLAFGMDNNTDFYITRRDGGTWYDNTFTLSRTTGKLTLAGDLQAANITGSEISASLIGTASIADLATTASHALTAVTASHALTAVTASHTEGTASIANNAVTASNINHLTQDVSITGSTDISGSVTAHSFNISSNAVGTPSIYSDSNINLSASNAVVITSSPLRLASFTNAETGSITGQVGDIIYNSDTADYKLYSGSWLTILNETSTASLADTSSFTSTGDGVFSGSFSGSFVGDASNLNVNPFPFTGSGEMQGTLTVHSDNDYIDDYVESYFAGTAINSDGDMTVTGSIFSTFINANSFTGSLSGSATSASLAETASYFGGTVTSASLAETASYFSGTITSASFAESSSVTDLATTSSHTVGTASFADTSTTASYGLNMTASNLYVEGTASITFLETIHETSSIIYSSGSTKFGDDTSDTHERTGSIDISGSLIVDGNANLVASQSVNNNTSSGSLSFWQGSQAEYNAISNSADNNTVYFVV